MQAIELINRARVELFDELIGVDDSDELWSNDTLLRYVNEAERNFARFTLSIRDRIEASVVAGTSIYNFPQKLLYFEKGQLNTSKRSIKSISLESFEKAFLLNDEDIIPRGTWENLTGTPIYSIVDYDYNQYRLYPIPVRTETMVISGPVYPDTLTSVTDTLTVDDLYTEGLLFKIKSLALAKLDADSANLEQSMLFSQKWQSFIQDVAKVQRERLKMRIMQDARATGSS